MGFLDNLNDKAMERMAHAAGPKVAEMLGHLRAGIEAQNAHLAAIAGNTSAIGERLAAIDGALVRIFALQTETRERLHALETAEQSASLHVATHAHLRDIETMLARVCEYIHPPTNHKPIKVNNGSESDQRYG